MADLLKSTENKLKKQHEGEEHLAVNDTWVRRKLTLLALRTTAHIFGRSFRKNGSPCVPISRNLIVKTGLVVGLTEAATMQFVDAHTSSVPVPKVHCAFVHRNRVYIVMERIHGQLLGSVLHTLSPEQHDKIFAQLRHMMQELRALKPPGDGRAVQSCAGGPVRDPRIPRGFPRFGPFKTIRDFHLWLRDGLSPEQVEAITPTRMDDPEWREIEAMVARQDGAAAASAPTVFTHGDLNPGNILVRGDEVVGIVDWECAGWWPQYWEYTAVWHGNTMMTDWQAELDHFLDRPCPEDVQMEITRNKWWGQI